MKKIISEKGLEIFIEKEEIYIDGNCIKYIDSGEEGNVYHYLDKAIKIYHDQPRKRVISDELLKKMQIQQTRRIILPVDRLYDEKTDKTLGYISEFQYGDKEQIYTYQKDKLLSEFYYLDEDFTQLGREQIAISDLRLSNFISNNDGFYLIDVGDYYLEKTILNTTDINKREFMNFFIQGLFFYQLEQCSKELELTKQEMLGIYRKTRYELLNNNQGLLHHLEENMLANENMKQYVRRIITHTKIHK